jgi:adenylate cyclase
LTESNIYIKRDLQSAGIIILVGLCFGIIYPLFGDDFQDTTAFINGISIGIIGGILLSVFEIFIFKKGTDKQSFLILLVMKTVLYFSACIVLILSMICLTRSLENNMNFWEYFYADEFQEFIFEGEFKIIVVYSMTILVGINFTRQINRRIGHGVLLSFISGKYHHPKEGELIFSFIDLKNSTQIAEELGDLKFHILLREFFNDISKCIFVTNGRIYRYVGDEIVISWSMRKGLKDANCIRAYFYINQELKKHHKKYLDMFGFVPEFHAAYHSGKVIRGEIGDVKSQLVFHGETMYIASKIENECSKLGYDILVSSDLKEKIVLPEIYEMQDVGKLDDMNLFTLIETNSIKD